jgi:hypothetical protein
VSGPPRRFRGENCGENFEHADELDQEEIAELDVEGDDERPRITLGAGRRDLWLCEECGKVLGVS